VIRAWRRSSLCGVLVVAVVVVIIVVVSVTVLVVSPSHGLIFFAVASHHLIHIPLHADKSLMLSLVLCLIDDVMFLVVWYWDADLNNHFTLSSLCIRMMSFLFIILSIVCSHIVSIVIS